eukprot:GEMP01072571.1.p1 GENE.GEMP01072571.1~~GEMP01072571.1.p1  ORF type:complete len:317 (+),score=67.31 GEMP01072571.1:193-1143(+)
MDRAGVLDVMPIPELEETCRRLEQSCANLCLFLSELETERCLLLRERRKYEKKLSRLGADSSLLNIDRSFSNNHRPFEQALVIRSLGSQLVLQTHVTPQDIESSQEVAKFSRFLAQVSTESVVEEIVPITFKPRDSKTSSNEIRLQRSDLSVKWGLQWNKTHFAASNERVVIRIYAPSPAHSYNLQVGANGLKIRTGMRLVAVNGKRFKVEMKEELTKSFDIDLLFADDDAAHTDGSSAAGTHRPTYVEDLVAFRIAAAEHKRKCNEDIVAPVHYSSRAPAAGRTILLRLFFKATQMHLFFVFIVDCGMTLLLCEI